jgi:hypothetical protein
MITIALTGRIGNQMFQYATSRALAHRQNTAVCIDLSSFDVRTWHEYELIRFPLDYPARLPRTQVILSTVEKRVLRRQRKLSKLFEIQGLGFKPEVNQLPDGTTLRGWFQSHRYFADCEQIIRREYRLDSFVNAAEIDTLRRSARGSPLVAVHVRRGDYVGHPLFAMDNLERYYSKACDFVLSKAPDAKFVLYSDDRRWCENWALTNRYTMLLPPPGRGKRSALSDLASMASCDHNIIANSTFSWWAAWLNNSGSKIVVMPARWLNPWTANECGVDVPGWVQID